MGAVCGIIGYVGHSEALPVLLNGLRRMEYRGYDSAGVAVLAGKKITTVKRQGKIEALATDLAKQPLHGSLGIGHTRWATHGEPSERNAHPHTYKGISIVHNGIIENYREIKAKLGKGHTFVSETDTEVLAHLITEELSSMNGDLPQAVISALSQVEGTFGIGLISVRHPDLLIAARRGSPILLGIGDTEIFLASDPAALVGYADLVVYLEDDEIAVCRPEGYEVLDLGNNSRTRKEERLDLEIQQIEKSGYDHFLLKEIMEQPRAVSDLLRGHLLKEEATAHLGGLIGQEDFLRELSRILIIGCGTAYYAGLLAKYLLERMTGVAVDVEIGSEFRYREPVIAPGTLAVLISQSGETADTRASLGELKRQGVPTFGLINVVGSSIAREVEAGLHLHCGPEISVASTKAFTSQVVGTLLLGLKIARVRGMSEPEGRKVIEALQDLPRAIQAVLDQAPKIEKIARRVARFENALFLGRDRLYPVALEGSHKLKEISYIHAEAYPAGEMKHGANALIDSEMLVVFLAPKNALQVKSLSNLAEVRARHGSILIIATEGDDLSMEKGEYRIDIPECPEWIQSLVANIPLQLLAYYTAVERQTDVDQPRNLAKSVTVE